MRIAYYSLARSFFDRNGVSPALMKYACCINVVSIFKNLQGVLEIKNETVSS